MNLSIPEIQKKITGKYQNTLYLLAEILLYLLLLAYLTWPWIAHINTHILSNGQEGDAYTFTYQLEWWSKCIKSFKSPYSSIPLTGVNSQVPAAYHDQTPIATTTGALLSLVFGPVTAYNLLIITCCLANGLAMSRLAHYMTDNRSAGVFAGLLYAWSPYIAFRYGGHLNLIQIFWLPLAILWIEQYKDTGNTRKLILGMLSTSALFISSPYYMLLLSPGLLVYLLLRLKPLKTIMFCAVWAAILVPLVLIPNIQVERQHWPIDAIRSCSASLFNYIFPYNWSGPAFGKAGEVRLFIGPIAMVFACLSAISPHKKRLIPLIALAAISIFLSFGPPFIYKLPGFSNIRCPSRAGIAVLFTVFLAASYGFSLFPKKSRYVFVVVTLISILVSRSIPDYQVSDTRPNKAEKFLSKGHGPVGILPAQRMGLGRILWGTRFHKRHALCCFGASIQPADIMEYQDKINRLYPDEKSTEPIFQMGAKSILVFTGREHREQIETINNMSKWKNWRIATPPDRWIVLEYRPVKPKN